MQWLHAVVLLRKTLPVKDVSQYSHEYRMDTYLALFNGNGTAEDGNDDAGVDERRRFRLLVSMSSLALSSATAVKGSQKTLTT